MEFSFAQFMQAGAFINQFCGHVVVYDLLNKTILLAASRARLVEHDWHTSLIVLHCGDFSLIGGGRACCGLISLGFEIGPAEDETHV